MQQAHEVITASQAFGRRVKELRRHRNFRSAAALAQAVSAHGVRVNRAAVTNIENGHRESVTVDEVYAFALALNTSPANLLTGVDRANYKVGDVELNDYELREWWRGNMPRPGTEEEFLNFYAVADFEAFGNFVARTAPEVEAARMVELLLRRSFLKQHMQPLGTQRPLAGPDDERTALRDDLDKWFARLTRAVETVRDELDA